MFDKKSEYALNKYDQDSIIYISVSGHIRLTRADFSSEEEFLKWKAWSDEDYHEREKSGRSFNDNRVDLNECLDVIGTVQSAEDEFFSKLIEADLQAVKKAMTERRLAAIWRTMKPRCFWHRPRTSLWEICWICGWRKN